MGIDIALLAQVPGSDKFVLHQDLGTMPGWALERKFGYVSVYPRIEEIQLGLHPIGTIFTVPTSWSPFFMTYEEFHKRYHGESIEAMDTRNRQEIKQLRMQNKALIDWFKANGVHYEETVVEEERNVQLDKDRVVLLVMAE